MQFGRFITVLCDSIYICIYIYILLFGFECFTVSNVVFIEGTVRQCSVAGLVLYCVTLCMLVYGFACITLSKVVFM